MADGRMTLGQAGHTLDVGVDVGVDVDGHGYLAATLRLCRGCRFKSPDWWSVVSR